MQAVCSLTSVPPPFGARPTLVYLPPPSPPCHVVPPRHAGCVLPDLPPPPIRRAPYPLVYLTPPSLSFCRCGPGRCHREKQLRRRSILRVARPYVLLLTEFGVTGEIDGNETAPARVSSYMPLPIYPCAAACGPTRLSFHFTTGSGWSAPGLQKILSPLEYFLP